MSITMEAKLLHAAVNDAAAVAIGGAGGAAPIFANVLIEEGDDGIVAFSATDLDTAIIRTIRLSGGELAREKLRVTVSAKYLAAIAAKLDAGSQVQLKLDGTQLIVTSGRSRFKLATLSADDFPAFPHEEWEAEFDLPAKAFAAVIDAASFAIGTDPTRYYLGGLYLHTAEVGGTTWLRAAATDGHRLARVDMPLPEGAEALPKAGVIVPRAALKVIRPLLDRAGEQDGEPGVIAVSISPRRIEVDLDGPEVRVRYIAKLIDGTFPDYTRVIPTGGDRTVKIDTATLKAAVERVETIASEKSRVVKFDVGKDIVTLDVTSAENGSATEELPADVQGAPLIVGFNSKYLLDVLGRAGGDTLTVKLGPEAAAPALLQAADDAPALYVLMPMRV